MTEAERRVVELLRIGTRARITILRGSECELLLAMLAPTIDKPACTPGCGELHTHCEDCGTVVDITERNACTSGCSRVYARCQACASEHWRTHHERMEANRPAWERVP